MYDDDREARGKALQVLKEATIACNGNGIPCTVRNLSAGGAAIDLPERADLPPSLTLTIESDRLIRRRHQV